MPDVETPAAPESAPHDPRRGMFRRMWFPVAVVVLAVVAMVCAKTVSSPHLDAGMRRLIILIVAAAALVAIAAWFFFMAGLSRACA